jgi:hypothetical protein
MWFIDRLFRRVESPPNESRVREGGFRHAPDLRPEDIGKLERRGWSGTLPEHGLHGRPPKGWKRHLVEGFGAIPVFADGKADPSGLSETGGKDTRHAGDAGGGDWGGGDSGGGGDGGGGAN